MGNFSYKYIDLKNPVAWWIRVDNYDFDDTSLIKIPCGNLFQEHSKGELKKLIKPYVKSWIHYPEIALDKKDLKLWHSEALKEDAKKYYKQWAGTCPTLNWNGHILPVKITRIGWRHITNGQRKERVALSKSLLPIANKILKFSDKTKPVELKSYYPMLATGCYYQHLGIRARVHLDGDEKKVQVVLKRYVDKAKGIEKFWFYSVHIIK